MSFLFFCCFCTNVNRTNTSVVAIAAVADYDNGNSAAVAAAAAADANFCCCCYCRCSFSTWFVRFQVILGVLPYLREEIAWAALGALNEVRARLLCVGR